MNRDKLLGLLCLLLGWALVLVSLMMNHHYRQQDRRAQLQTQQILAALETRETRESTQPVQIVPTAEPVPATIPAAAVPAETTLITEPTDPPDPPDPPSLSSEILEGHEYVGYLSFPSLDRRLPVMRIKFLEDLQIAPCLEKGSPLTDDAVISAHNYPAHFGPIRDWEGGEEVIFSTLEGEQIHYKVSLVETILPTDVLTVMESPHDLVLYTCTTGGEKRVMIACDRA